MFLSTFSNVTEDTWWHSSTMTIPYSWTKGLTSPFSKHDCISAISITPCSVFEVESKQPMGEKTFFLPRFLGISGSVKSMSRNSERRSCHCKSNAFEWISMSVFIFFRAINAAAVTVFPKAVVADNTPLVWAMRVLMAFNCSSRSLPLNATAICLPWLVLSTIS